jgi:hypothetical protein
MGYLTAIPWFLGYEKIMAGMRKERKTLKLTLRT